MNSTLEAIAELVGGDLIRGEATQPVTGFSSLEEAGADDISFYVGGKFEAALRKSGAGAILIQGSPDGLPCPEEMALIQTEDATRAFDLIVAEFGQKPPPFVPGLAEGSHVDPTASLDPRAVSVLPGAVILEDATVGAHSRIHAGAVIGHGSRIGEHCEIGPNVTIREGCVIGDRVIIHAGAVIGADGFGYEFEQGRHRKVEQTGIVRIENDVEIGASTTIDRARFGETVIGEGTKIDNQVQIGHNVIIGKHCIIVAQCGISGSAKIGNYVTLAARVGVAGHIEIADQVTVGGKSGVIASIKEPGGTYFGYPAKPMKETLRNKMQMKRLGSLFNRVKELEKKMEELDDRQLPS